MTARRPSRRRAGSSRSCAATAAAWRSCSSRRCVLLTLLRFVYADAPQVFDRVGGPLLALFPFVTMFLVTSVAMLSERSTGTLERLLAMPLGKGDLLGGYALAFGSVAVVQTLLASALCLGPLGLDVAGAPGLVVLLAVLDALLGTALGLLLSAFARTEFQAVQFLPAVVLPQLLLCGLFAPARRHGRARCGGCPTRSR